MCLDMRWFVPILCALLVTGCAPVEGRPSLHRRLQSDAHDVRAAAVVEAGSRGDRKAVPYLVDRLEDDQADIRLFAIQALRQMTEENFGYRSYGNELARREAVRRWRQWLDGHGDEETAR